MLCLIALASVTGCGPELESTAAGGATPEEVASVSAAVQGGYEDQGDSHVVALSRLDGSHLCSGTLIAPNVVLTAQHCIADPSGAVIKCPTTEFGPPHAPSEFVVSTNRRLSDDPDEYVLSNNYFAVREIMVPPGRKYCGADLAIVVLATPVPTATAIPGVPRVDATVVRFEAYSAVGYGRTVEGSADDSGLRRRRDGLVNHCVGAGCFGQNLDIKEWLGDTGVCSGDSGGPAIDLDGRLIGVVSRGPAGCDKPVYGHVFSWAGWIKESTAYGSQLAGLEAPTWTKGATTEPEYHAPVGRVCTRDDECAGQHCLDSVCSRPCDALATCPGGYRCNTEGWCTPDDMPGAGEGGHAAGGDDSSGNGASSDGVGGNGAGGHAASGNDAKSKGADGGEPPTESSCSVSTLGHLNRNLKSKDPTKPIPWKAMPFAVAAVAMLRRRRRQP